MRPHYGIERTGSRRAGRGAWPSPWLPDDAMEYELTPDSIASSRSAARATDREVGVVEAVLVAGSDKAAAHRLGLSRSTGKHHLANARSKVGATATAQLVWILAQRLPEPEGVAQTDERRQAGSAG